MSRLSLSKSNEKWVALGLIAAFIAISLATIAYFSPWHDESYSATLIEGNYSDIIHRTALDVHPPLYYLLLKTWSSVFGSSVVGLRLFSLVCMTGAVIVAWRLMRRWYGWRSGLYALAGMAAGAFLIRYSQEMRMYALGALLAMSSTYIFWRLFNDKLSPKTVRLYVTGYVLLITAAIYTHYFLVFLPVTHVLFLLFNYRPRTSGFLGFFKTIRSLPARWWVSFGLPLLFFLPWLPTVLDQFKKTHGAFWIGQFKVENLSSSFIDFLLFRQQWELSGWGAFAGVAILVSVIILLISWYRSKEATDDQQIAKRLSGYLLIIPLLLLIILSLPPFQPAYQDRYISFYAPILYGSVALCMVHWAKRHKGLIAKLPVIILVGTMAAGIFFVSLLGNSQAHRPFPHFTIYKLDNYMEKMDPGTTVVSSTLWTFMDAHITIGKTTPTFLYAPTPIGKYGDGSAVYNRTDLLIKDLNTLNGPRVWLIEESGLPSIKVPSKWHELNRYQAGYARVILFQINN